MANESQKHQDLKKEAVNLLLKKGFSKENILEEAELIINDTRVIVDLYAKNKRRCVIVEVGNVKKEKIKLFEDNKLNYLVLPYTNIKTITFHIEEKLLRKFKSYCAGKGVFMHQALLIAIQLILKEKLYIKNK